MLSKFRHGCNLIIGVSVKKFVLYLFVIISFSLGGCANAPLNIDVSDSIYTGSNPVRSIVHSISSIVFVNKATDGKMVNTTLGSDSVFPIVPLVPTKATVEDDVRRYFDRHLVINSDSVRSIKVSILKADSYWVWSSAAKIPFVGILFVDADTDFGINLKVLIEIEQAGKVISSYLFDEKIVIQAKSTTEEKIKDSYKALISNYRETFFGHLDLNFINRYF